ARAVLRMELDAEDAAPPHRRRKAVALVGAPGRHAAGLLGPASVAVREVGDGKRRALEKRIAGLLQGVPTDLGDAARAEPGDLPREDPEALARPLLAGIEEELHPEADA